MASTIIAMICYISTLSLSCVTFGLIIKNWHDYGQLGQKPTRITMAVSNGSMVVYLLILVARISLKVFQYSEQLDTAHMIMSIFILIAFLAWLKLFLE